VPDALRAAPLRARLTPSPRGAAAPFSSIEERDMTVKYTKDHEWIDAGSPQRATVGITRHAQDALGDIVFVELPKVGATLKRGDVAGVVESVKAAADLYMPASGEVVEVNEKLRADPSLANSAPESDGWFFRVRLSEPSELDGLLDATGYDTLLKDA
jgi:glycine cleavage system H protein